MAWVLINKEGRYLMNPDGTSCDAIPHDIKEVEGQKYPVVRFPNSNEFVEWIDGDHPQDAGTTIIDFNAASPEPMSTMRGKPRNNKPGNPHDGIFLWWSDYEFQKHNITQIMRGGKRVTGGNSCAQTSIALKLEACGYKYKPQKGFPTHADLIGRRLWDHYGMTVSGDPFKMKALLEADYGGLDTWVNINGKSAAEKERIIDQYLRNGPLIVHSSWGHVFVIMGKDDNAYSGLKAYICDDPAGERMVSQGRWDWNPTNGDNVLYSVKTICNIVFSFHSWVSEKYRPRLENWEGETEQVVPDEPRTPEHQVNYLSEQQVAKLFDNNKNPRFYRDLMRCCNLADISTPTRLRHFCSQTMHESGRGRYLKELASGRAYNGRKDLGNTQPGDGPRFKGAGILQVTGRVNYKKLAEFVDDERVMEGVDYVAEHYPCTAAAVWWIANGMNNHINQGATVKSVTRRVNGGFNHLAERRQYYAECYEVIES
jgi:predicted chitinase